jgi:hypothetical protein
VKKELKITKTYESDFNNIEDKHESEQEQNVQIKNEDFAGYNISNKKDLGDDDDDEDDDLEGYDSDF